VVVERLTPAVRICQWVSVGVRQGNKVTRHTLIEAPELLLEVAMVRREAVMAVGVTHLKELGLMVSGTVAVIKAGMVNRHQHAAGSAQILTAVRTKAEDIGIE